MYETIFKDTSVKMFICIDFLTLLIKTLLNLNFYFCNNTWCFSVPNDLVSFYTIQYTLNIYIYKYY